MAVFYALFSTVFFTIEAMLIRYMDIKFGIPGDVSAFCFLFFEGICGTTALLVSTAMGYGIFDFQSVNLLWVSGAGVTVAIGLALQNYALSTGIAGVTFAIVNFSTAI